MNETRTGALVDGRYRLGDALGSGGMSRVWRAEDEALGRQVAIKILREPLVQHTGRFEREARTMGRLRHPAVVKVYGYGMTRGEEPGSVLPYLVLELVDDAVSLYALIEERGALPPAEAVRLMRPIAGALAEAHAHGIVHRDLKPENILIQHAAGLDPQLRLLDFGIAAWDEPTAQRLTQTGQIFGTPAYMAPEHATGQFGAGPTADVWSLGVMLHELVTGDCPFRGPHVTATLFNITNKDAPRLEGVPDGFQKLVDDCLVKDHEARLPDAAAVLERLDALVRAETGALPRERAGIGTDPTVGMDVASGEVQPVDPPVEPAEGPALDDDLEDERLPAPSLGLERPARDERQSMQTVALDPPRRPSKAPAVISGLAGLLIGLLIGWGNSDPPAPAGTTPVIVPPAVAVATDAAPPVDQGPPPLVDEALAPAQTFLDGGDAERATTWIEANPDVGHADARERLLGLIELARGRVDDGLGRLDPLLTRRPDLARDTQVQTALMAALDARNAAGLIDMLGIMVEAAPALEARLLELTDDDDYRTRRRAYRVIQQAGHDVEAATLRYYVRNLRLLDCDLRKDAVDRLRGLGDPAAIGPIKAMDARTGFFDNLCMDGAVDRALGVLYAAERRRARAEARAAAPATVRAEDAAGAGVGDAAAGGAPGDADGPDGGSAAE